MTDIRKIGPEQLPSGPGPVGPKHVKHELPNGREIEPRAKISNQKEIQEIETVRAVSMHPPSQASIDLKEKLTTGEAELHQCVPHAKEKEREVVFDTLVSASVKFLGEDRTDKEQLEEIREQFANQPSLKERTTFLQTKLERIIDRAAERLFTKYPDQKDQITKEIEACKKGLSDKLPAFDQEKDVCEFLQEIWIRSLQEPSSDDSQKPKFPHLKKMANDPLFAKEVKEAATLFDPKAFAAEYGNLKTHLETIAKLLQKRTDLKEQNVQVLSEIREALNNKAYQFLKENESHFAVGYLHALCLASYTEPKVMKAFSELGQYITHVTEKGVGDLKRRKQLFNKLKARFDQLVQANPQEKEKIEKIRKELDKLNMDASPKEFQKIVHRVINQLRKEIKDHDFRLDVSRIFREYRTQQNPGDIKDFSLAERVLASRKHAYDHGALRNDRTLKYAQSYFKQLIGAFLSTKFGQKLATSWLGKKLGFSEYDPRGQLENNAGALYQEELLVGAKKVTSRNVYTPSPTIGNSVAPEAEAILQGMENRNKMSPKQLGKTLFPYLGWTYVNLQDITSGGENGRCVALMELNKKYPLSFHGITLSLDTEFYKAGLHGKDDDKVRKLARDAKPLDNEYKKSMVQQVTSDKNRTLENRQVAKGGGCYFTQEQIPDSSLHAIVDTAFDLVRDKKDSRDMDPESWNWYHKAAFRELVNLGIIKYFQAKVAAETVQEREQAQIMTTTACKENVDRGGRTNAELLYGSAAEETAELIEDTVLATDGRPYMSRGRQMLADRAEPMVGLALIVSHEELNTFFKDMARLGGASPQGATVVK